MINNDNYINNRFGRHLLLDSWSPAKQNAVQNLAVAIDYSLPLCAMYLAGSGVSTIILLESPSESSHLIEHLRKLNPNSVVTTNNKKKISRKLDYFITRTSLNFRQYNQSLTTLITVSRQNISVLSAGNKKPFISSLNTYPTFSDNIGQDLASVAAAAFVLQDSQQCKA